MRLTDLDPAWMFDVGVPSVGGQTHRRTAHGLVADAQGVLFLCPKCFAANGGHVGTHGVLCWFKNRGVPDAAQPGPGRWTPTGSDFRDLTLTPSIALTSGCMWHGFITAGETVDA